MTLTQAMQILGIAERQQISDEVAEAIRTVLAEMKKQTRKPTLTERYWRFIKYYREREEKEEIKRRND